MGHRLLILLVLLISFGLRVTALNAYPPGISNDEAVNVVDGYHIYRAWNFPFYEDFGRPEPTYRVVLAMGMTLFGPGVWQSRFTTALIGTITVALAYWATFQILPRHRFSRWAALVAAISLGIAIGHITLSRALYRGILQPPVMLLWMGFLFRAIRHHKPRDFLWAGLWLAVGLYTYTAYYVIPFALIVLGISLWLWQRQTLYQALPNLMKMSTVAFLVALPLLILFMVNREALLGRAASTAAVSTTSWLERLQAAWQQLFITGDENPQYNVANAPVIATTTAVLLFIGSASLLLHIRQAYALFLLALFALANVPAVASAEITHGLRIVGIFAVFPLIAAEGARWLAQFAARTPLRRGLAATFAASALVWLFGQAGVAWNTYRDFWEQAPDWRLWRVYGRELTHSEWFFRTDRRAFAHWLNQADTSLWLPAEELNRPTTRAWTIGYPVERPSETTLPQSTLVWPNTLEGDIDRNTVFVPSLLHHHSLSLYPPVTLMLHADSTPIEQPESFLQPALNAYAQTAFQLLPASLHPLGLAYGGDIQLVAWAGPDTLPPSTQFDFALAYQALRRIGHDYFIFAQLQTQDFQRLTGFDQQITRWIYPPTQWQADETIYEAYTLPITATLAPGAYRLVVGIYPIWGNPLLAQASNGQSLGSSATIAWLKVPLPAIAKFDDATPVGAVFNEQFILETLKTTLSAQSVDVAIQWQSLAHRPNIDATIFIHILDEQGNIIAQQDVRPLNGTYPTFIWDAGERIHTEHTIALPSNVDAQALRLRVGLYTFPGPQNLSVYYQDTTNQALDLGAIARWGAQ